MKLTNIKYVRDLLERHGFEFKKRLGQNFLINPSVCPRMAELVADCESVLEIGAGIGVLTRELAEVSEQVAAVEVDDRLIPILSETLADCANVEIIHGDILKLDVKEIVGKLPGKTAVCANLPYYITTPIIASLLEERVAVERIIVMVQKEVATRLCAPLGSKESGAVSALIDYYTVPKVEFSVSRGSFMPCPTVDSAVISLSLKKEVPLAGRREAMFFKLVKAAFSQRRKTVTNTLGGFTGISKADFVSLCERAGISPGARPQEIRLEQFVELASIWPMDDK